MYIGTQKMQIRPWERITYQVIIIDVIKGIGSRIVELGGYMFFFNATFKKKIVHKLNKTFLVL